MGKKLFRIISIIRKIVLILTIFLIFNGFQINPLTQNDALYMYANLTTFTFWIVFLMGSILLAPVGRIFCALCPVGEINYLSSRFGKKFTLKKNFGFLQGISMLIIFILVINFHISKYPYYTSLLIITALLFAGILGILFKGNTFCLNICPANGFLKFYSKFSILKIVCSKNAKISNPCMVFLNPCNHQREHCHLCFRCFEKSEGLKIKISIPEINNVHSLSMQDFFNFSILLGLTSMAFIRVIREVREAFVYPPFIISQTFNIDEKYLIFLVVFFGVVTYPLCILIIISLFKRIFIKDRIKNILSETIIQFILPLFSIHFILSLVKLNARLGFIPFLLNDVSGKDTVMLYQLKKISIPNDIIPISFAKYLIILTPIIFFIFWYNLYIKGKQISLRNVINALSVILFFLFIEACIFMWLFRGII